MRSRLRNEAVTSCKAIAVLDVDISFPSQRLCRDTRWIDLDFRSASAEVPALQP